MALEKKHIGIPLPQRFFMTAVTFGTRLLTASRHCLANDRFASSVDSCIPESTFFLTTATLSVNCDSMDWKISFCADLESPEEENGTVLVF